jgi:hypothetical protein
VSTQQGVDGRRVASILRRHGASPDAEHRPVIPPKPPGADELRVRAYLHRLGVVL